MPASDLGPWAGADLAGTATTFGGEGSDGDIERKRRFGGNVGRVALRRIRQHLGTMRRDAIAIFLLQPDAPAGASTRREPLLGDGGVEICGRIWFVNVTAQSGRALAAAEEDDGAMFDEVERLGYGNVPAVVFNPQVATPSMRFYADGLSAEDRFEAVDILDREVSLEDIRRVIDVMHERNLCTPDAQVAGASMWADATKHCAASNAEALAQLQVKTALWSGLVNCEIRHEQTMRAGRVDVEVTQRLADGTTVIPAEIEIKVLRERNRRGKKWSESFNRKWIERGVRQAAAYRDDRGAKAGLLCCFDMRDGDRGEAAAFDPVSDYAGGLGVTLHRNFLHNDAESWRKANYG